MLEHERHAGRLQVGEEDRVVDVAHRVEVAEADRLPVHKVEAVHVRDANGGMAGEKTRRAIESQPEWLRKVPTDRRLPEGRVLHTGCGTSFHAAQTGGWAEQALELVLRPREADVLVAISHEGETPLTLEAARAFDGPVWLITGKPESPLGELADEIVVATPEVEVSWCHTVELHVRGRLRSPRCTART